MYEAREEDLSARGQGPLRQPALGLRLADAAGVLRPAVAGLERPAGWCCSTWRRASSTSSAGAVAAGLHLPGGLLVISAWRCSWSRRWRDGCGAASPARRRCTPRSSCGSSARSKAPQRAHALDRQPASLEKLRARSGSSTWPGVRSPVDRLYLRRLLHADRRAGHGGAADSRSGRGNVFWVLFYGFATYGNAGFMREQVCKYMCPYARFQSAMFDRDTLIVTTTRSAASRAAPRVRRAGRLHRLLDVRAGLPDRHRHPQGPAVRVHRLRRLRRCLQQRDGQDG
jgi:hypothetical protein